MEGKEGVRIKEEKGKDLIKHVSKMDNSESSERG